VTLVRCDKRSCRTGGSVGAESSPSYANSDPDHDATGIDGLRPHNAETESQISNNPQL
jgi:hypothetical protein